MFCSDYYLQREAKQQLQAVTKFGKIKSTAAT